MAVLIALGAMAFGAAAAQGSFLVLGIPFEQVGLEEEPIDGQVDEPFSPLVEPKNYEVNCPEVNVSGALLPTDADLKLTLQKCAVFTMEPLEELKGCHVFQPAGEKLIFFLNASILTVLHKTKEENGQEQVLTFLLAEQLPENETLGVIHLKKKPAVRCRNCSK